MPLSSGPSRNEDGSITIDSAEGNSVTVDGTLSTIPDRATQKPGRTAVEGFIDGATTGQTAHTVTQGKTLYVTSMTLSASNNGFSVAGRLHIRDSTTVKIPLVLNPAGLGASSAFQQLNGMIWNFSSEPLKITTSLNLSISAGTITYSFSFIGYEE